jgi:hypothetical protein
MSEVLINFYGDFLSQTAGARPKSILCASGARDPDNMMRARVRTCKHTTDLDPSHIATF